MAAARHRRAKWQREIGESKVDMGLLAPLSPQALESSLYMAVLENDHQAIRDAARLGADPDMAVDGKLGEPSGTLLHFAVRHSSLRAVLSLLQAGADPAARDSEGCSARDVALQRPGGARMRNVLELWEQKKDPNFALSDRNVADPALDGFEDALSFDALGQNKAS